jgi:phosphoribosyl 1,2-cyclic phosphate phosphodiesterase
VCREARAKGVPYTRSGPSAFLHDIDLLIDTPAEIASQLNRSRIGRIKHLIFTHFDPDHVEGFRVVEQIALDFRTWRAYPKKQVNLLLPKPLDTLIREHRSLHGPFIDYYTERSFVQVTPFQDKIRVEDIEITAIPVGHSRSAVFIYIFEGGGHKVVYAPCDIKPFPEHRDEVKNADLLITQPGIFEDGLKHDYRYPINHVSRTTLYTFQQTMDLAERIAAKDVLFVHLEEYWNRSYDDYVTVEKEHQNIRFAYDGMQVKV